ncbi:MAG: aldo/keto reductase [Desertifilum sp. SIO1I2]|nr:aldo/keto reductase [Desertifilum sp. SIO1I2]
MKAEEIEIPHSLIVGCWQLDDRSWKSLSEPEIERAIDTYLALGLRCFDTADIYGRSESLIGRFLKGRDCTIFTKAVFFGEAPTPSQVRNKIETSLRYLKQSSLDCVQVHWHNPQLDFSSTFETFNQLVEQGKIRALGVTNFNTPMLKQALQLAPIRYHQVQYSLIDRRVENGMQQLCLDHHIGLLPYGPLAGGYLSDKFRGVQSPPNQGSHARSFYYSSMIREHGGWSPVLALLEDLATVGSKYNLTIAQVALNWVLRQPGVGGVISGLTLDRRQMQKNVEAMHGAIAPEDIEWLTARSQILFQQPGDIYSYERQ